MDLCMSYLYESSKLLEDYEEIDLYRSVFEAGDVANIEANNAQIEAKSESLLKKAANMIKAIIQKTKDIISNIMAWFGASDAEKDKFKKFRDECAANPEFAKMKISLTNWRAIDQKYNEAIKKAEAEYKSIKDEEVSARQNRLGDLSKYLKNITSAGMTSMTVEAALRLAQDNQDAAANIKTALDLDFGLINTLEGQIGAKETKKFKKKINALNSRFAFRRWIAGARESQGKKLQDCMSEIFNNVNNAYMKVDHRARGNDDYKSASNTVISGVLQGVAANKHSVAKLAADQAAQTNTGGKLVRLKNRIFNNGEFDVHIDTFMNQFKDDKFKRSNLKKLNDADLQTLLRQTRNAQTDLNNIIKTNHKASKHFNSAGKLEWNKTIQSKSKIDTLADNIQAMVDSRNRRSRR